MDDGEQWLIGLAGIAVVGIGAQWLAWRIRVPSILLLLVAGLVVGPTMGWLDPEELLGPLLFPFVSLSVAVILFEGGLSLRLAELRGVGGVLARLVTVGALVTFGLSTLGAHWLTGLSWQVATLLGAILTVTGPTVIGPLMRHVRPRGSVGAIAKWEGIVVDVIGATVAVLVLRAIEGGADHAGTLLDLGKTLAVGAGLGLLAAFALAWPLSRDWVPDSLASPVTLATVLGTFTVCQRLQQESGLLAVTLMGFVLANQRATPVKHIVEFKENLRVLLISTLFILLAARIQWSELVGIDAGVVTFVVLLFVVVRPLSVFVSTVGSGLPWRERALLAWLAPRGIVAAAVSALFALRLEERLSDSALDVEGRFPDAPRLASLAFVVIIATVGVYGLTVPWLARRLGLSDADPRGVLIVGASPFARAFASALAEEGARVVLVDTNRGHVTAARLAGLEAVYGSILAERVEERVNLAGLGRLLALTPNDEVNALAALRFRDVFGRAGVYQLVPSDPERESGPAELRGRSLFGADAGFWRLERRVAQGAEVRRTRLSDTFDFAAYREHHGAAAVPLARLPEGGAIEIFDATTPPDPQPGDVLLALVDPDPVEPAPARAGAEVAQGEKRAEGAKG